MGMGGGILRYSGGCNLDDGMITTILYSSIAAVLLSGVDTWRINRVKGKVANINHTVSAGLAVVVAGLWFALFGFKFSVTIWQVLIYLAVYTCIRGLLYDPSLNIMRRLPIDHISKTTSSGIDQRLNRVSFWKRRALYGAGLAIVLLINYFL